MSVRRLLLISLAVLVAGIGLWRYWWTALDHHPEQDACSFGPVTNAEYRQMLERVKALQAEGKGHWAPLRGPTRSAPNSSPPGPSGSPQQLAARINELSVGMTSLYERRMVMHAVMRAAGAYLHNSRRSGLNDFSRDLAANRIPRSFISAIYVMHSNYRGDGLGMILLAPFASFAISLNGDYEPGMREPEWWEAHRNMFTISGLDISVLMGFLGVVQPYNASVLRLPRAESCLPDLDPRIAEIYTEWARRRLKP
jgi:hypothetical protein